MKSRSGFVSNSSTSSFILVGFEISDYDFEDEKYDDKDMYEIAEGAGLEYQSDNGLMGKSLSSWSDYDVVDFDFSLEELEEMRNKVKEGMEKLGVEKEIRFYAGTYSS